MIAITRRLAMQLRPVFRQALNLSTRGIQPPLTFQTGRDGLRVRSRWQDAAVEYHVPGDHPIEQIPVPFELLADSEARRDDPVQLEMASEGRVLAQWRDGSVPQMIQYDASEPVDAAEFPRLPKKVAGNPPRLLKALHDAMQTTEPESIRYATNCVQLRGTAGQIVATDGRQLLVQSGFQFPWKDDLLVPRTNVFGSQQLPPDDAEFLRKNLPRLPGDDEYNLPVTVDLNGQVAVRSKAREQVAPTELVLSGATLSGDPIRLNMNRQYLARALQLGFRQVHIYDPKVPVLCEDEGRQYVWALLDPTSAVAPSTDAIRITSPQAADAAVRARPRPQKRKVPMPSSNADENGRSKSRSRSAAASHTDESHDVTALIEQAQALKASLRDALSKTGELVASLKRQKKQSRIVASTLASLRQLQTIDS